MRNFKLLMALCAFVLSIIIYSCSRSDNSYGLDSKSTELRSESIEQFKSFNLPFPEGTVFSFSGNELNFDLPEPYYIIGKDLNGNFYRSIEGGSGGVTCKCTKGSGCDPIKSGGDYGCLMKDGCSTCKKSTSSITGINVDLVEIIIVNPEYGIGVDDFSQLSHKLILPSNFLDASEFVDLISDLNSNMENPISLEKKVIFINALGYILPLEIPSEMDNTSISFRNVGGGDGAGVTCSCNIAGKSCPKESKFGVVWCNSDNCTNCSMSGRIIDKNGIEKELTIADGIVNVK